LVLLQYQRNLLDVLLCQLTSTKLQFQEDLKQLQSDLAPYVAKFLEMANTKDKLLDKVEE
jgi:hypothetical protein